MYSYSASWNIVVAKRNYAISTYGNCIEKIDDVHSINILQSISNEEEGHIEEAKKLFKIIEEDFPRTKSAKDLPQRSKL